LPKNFHFLFRPKTKFWLKTPSSMHEKKTGWCHWALIFCVDVHMEVIPLPLSAWVHLSLVPLSCGRHKWMAPDRPSRRCCSLDTLYMSLFRYISRLFCRSFEPLPLAGLQVRPAAWYMGLGNTLVWFMLNRNSCYFTKNCTWLQSKQVLSRQPGPGRAFICGVCYARDKHHLYSTRQGVPCHKSSGLFDSMQGFI